MPRLPRPNLAAESASGVVVLVATGVALVWANSRWGAGYDRLWLDRRAWVNDGLMTIFFLAVGVEIKRELTLGELRNRRVAVLPVVAAVGGMVVPALIFLALNPSGDAAAGWGIPMATDIAFAVGVLALVARSVPPAARAFLLTLAIVDDIGAILVIALFYEPGVHPTLAGVAVGLLVPVSRLETLEQRLRPWASFVIVPVFALANAGIDLDGSVLRHAAGSTVTLGVAGGLVLGKALGITVAAWLAVRSGVAELPERATWRLIAGLGALGGIGFTVSLFITELAFDAERLVDEAKVGILAASLVASLAGALLLRDAGRRDEEG